MNASHLLSQLARLSGQPLLMRGEDSLAHSARLGGLLRRALAGDLPAAPTSAFGEAAPKPWDLREQVTYAGATAIIPVHGFLAGGMDAMSAWWMECCRYEAIQAAAAEIAARSGVRSVVLDISSPGGYTIGCQETVALLQRDLGDKLTVAWSASQDCSAAYWLSCACERMIFAPSATVANVGTRIVINDYSKMYAEAGIEVKQFTSGAYKGIGTPGTSLTAEQEQFIQEYVDRLNGQFLSAVHDARPKAAEADLQGQWFDGATAVEKNLADATALNLAELLATLQTLPAAA